MNTKAIMCAIATLAMAAGVARGGFYDDDPNVVVLSEDNFAEEVYGTEQVWVVEFYAPWCGHCKAFAPEYAKAAKELRGLVKVGAVDCDYEKELCSNMKIQGFPTVAIFPSEQKRQGETLYKEGSAYQGARKAKALTKAALRMLPSFVTVVDEADDVSGLGAFLASTPATGSKKLPFRPAKVLLFTDKKKMTPLIKAMALNNHYVIDFAAVVNPTQATLDKYGVAKLPALVAIESADIDSDGDDGNEKEPAATLFEGKVSRVTLARFLAPYAKAVLAKYRAASIKPEDVAAFAAASSSSGNGFSGKSKSEDPHEWDLQRIASSADWDKYCVGKQGVCIVAVLDPYNSPDEVPAQEQTLRELAEKYRGKLHIMWLGAREQPKFVDTFDMRSGFPALIVLNPARTEGGVSKYIKYVGSFSKNALTEFLDALAIGGRGAHVLEKEIVIDDVNPEDFLPPKDVPLDDADEYDDVVITDSKQKSKDEL